MRNLSGAAVRQLLPVVFAAVCAMPAIAAASPSGVVISQFRVDGPSGGNDEFVEILNTGSSPVAIGGWQLQGCASGSGAASSRVTVSSGVSLAAGQYYLFTNNAASGYSGSTTGDQTYATGFSNSGKSGIRIVDNTAAAQDGVGLAGSVCFEGTPMSTIAGSGSNYAYQRNSNGTQDTNVNASDFTGPGASNPHNSGGTSGGGGCANSGLRIFTVQGSAHLSPYAGQCVAAVPGIVTQLASTGFYMQDPDGDGNVNTSDGIFVFTSSAPSVTVGSSVSVSGTVSEYRPQGTGNLSTTEIDSPTVAPLTSSPFSSGTVVPTVIGAGGRMPPTQFIDSVAEASVESPSHVFDPTVNGIDFFETLEGMLVQVNDPRVIAPTNSGAVWVTADDGANATGVNAHGGLSLVDRGGSQGVDYNPERIEIYPASSTVTAPVVNVGDHLSTITGVMSYYYNPELDYVTPPTVTTGPLQPAVSTLTTGGGRLLVGTYNLENLDANDNDICDGAPDQDVADGRFATEGRHIVHNLGTPDILGVEEIQDNDGCTDDGVVDGSVTLNTLVQNIVNAGGPQYSYITVTPDNDTDGGVPGGNIRQAILYNPARVTFVPGTIGAGTSQQATSLVDSGGKLQLTYSPGRIDPTNAAWSTSRKPLAATFDFNGQRVLMIVNHFDSKDGDGELWGPTQPPVLSSAVQRTQQAQIEHDFVQQALALEPQANVIAVGDYNDFDFSDPLQVLSGASVGNVILSDLATALLVPEERYSYVFDGNSQELDHIYVTAPLLPNAQVQPVHVNSEFANQASDHDPTVASLVVGPDTTPDALNFTKITGAEPLTDYTSDPLTVTGINTPAPISVAAGSYSINGGGFTTTPGTIKPGDALRLRITSSSSFKTALDGKVTVGGVKGYFEVKTRPADTTPDTLTFPTVSGATTNTAYISAAATVSGVEIPVAISIINGAYSVNGQPFTTAPGMVQNGQSIRLQVTSSASAKTQVYATVTVGTGKGYFRVKTR